MEFAIVVARASLAVVCWIGPEHKGGAEEIGLRNPLTLVIIKKVIETYAQAIQVRWTMMNGMMPGMMVAMGLIWVLVVVVLVLSAAALVKYLRSGNNGNRRWANSRFVAPVTFASLSSALADQGDASRGERRRNDAPAMRMYG
jgi:uncharacterized membrane protein